MKINNLRTKGQRKLAFDKVITRIKSLEKLSPDETFAQLKEFFPGMELQGGTEREVLVQLVINLLYDNLEECK